MSRQRRESRKGFLERLQIPPDLSRKDCILTLCGSGELYVENYRCILEYLETEIRLLTRNGTLLITGMWLTISSYTGEEMYITGKIQKISLS